ncbi:MAG: electron transfer flavoprotein subunit alpha/FixB family protein [Candidatus Marinimicrobia bacterium]|nr:electron transfer flavoprotein subunit alpha/FixB family protein [Candidatus Neomarinimicrobiota bacterium]
MGQILVYAEQRDGQLKSYALEAISEGRRLADASGMTLSVCLIGSGVSGLAATIGSYGAETVYMADDASLATYSPGAYTKLLVDTLKSSSATVVLLSSSSMGREIAALLAAKANASLLSDVIGTVWESDHLVVKRPVYAGKAFLRIAAKRFPVIVTLRPNVFAADEKGGSAAIEKLAVSLSEKDARVTITGTSMKDSGRPELTEASIIVSGGRGMGGPENYKIIEELADTFGAAVGASRAAVDAGWRPHSDQVGQTGKTVSPNLYIACGISGAIQHLAGMNSSKCIVAINTDPEAPIFKVADYGIVADLFEVVPALNTAAKELLA